MPMIMKRLNVISRCQSLFRGKHTDVGLCPCQHTFVLAICRAPGRSQEELARDICLSKSAVARALSDLEKKGYVTRTRGEADKRELLIFPTEKMTAALPHVRALTKEWIETITEGISQKDLAVFEATLAKMEQNARAALFGGQKGGAL